MAKPTVLIVDDDQEVTAYLNDVFRADGWKVLTEKDGDWALKTFKSRRIDAVILDILIPVLNGFQVAEAIRADPRGGDLPIVIMSGIYRGGEHRQEAIDRYGLEDYLNKPVEGDRVRRLLRDALDRRDTERVRHRTGPKRRVEKRSLAAPTPGPSTATPAPTRSAHPIPHKPPPLQGTLRAYPLGLLLGNLYRLQATGGLFLMRDKVKKVIYLDTGYPVFAKANLLRETLGQQLVDAGVLDPAERDQHVAEAKAARHLLGQHLLAAGVLDERTLTAHLQQNLTNKLLDGFHWPDGAYQFRENAAPPPGTSIQLTMSPAMLILQGIQSAYSPERLEAESATGLSAFPAPADDPLLRLQRLTPPAEEVGSIIETLDGRRSLLRILEDGAAPRITVLKVTLALRYAGALDLYDRTLRLPPLRAEPRRMSVYGLGALPSPGDPGVEEVLAADQVRLKSADHFRVLGLSRNATTQDVEAAFDGRAWRYHPDRFRGEPPHIRDLAESLFGRLRSAYLSLRSPRRRESYLEQLAESFPDPDPLSPEDRNQADQHHREATEHLAAGRYDEASWHFRRAVGLVDGVAGWHAQLALAVHRSNPTDPVATRDARQHLERALQLDPDLDQAHLVLGHLALAEQDVDRARDHYARAAELNPSNHEATAQLEQLGP